MKRFIAQIIAALMLCSTCLGYSDLSEGMWTMSSGEACTGVYGWASMAATEQTATAYQAVAIKRVVNCSATSGTFNSWLGNASGTSKTWLAIIARDSGGVPGTVVWRSSAQTISASSSVALRSVAFTADITSGTYHFIVFENTGTSSVLQWMYTASSGAAKHVASSSVASLSDLSSLSWLDTTSERSINVTF